MGNFWKILGSFWIKRPDHSESVFAVVDVMIDSSTKMFPGHLCVKMQFCRSTVCCVAIVIVVVGLVIDSVAANDASADPLNRLRRSVNFTPSWGKRSGEADAASELTGLAHMKDFRKRGLRTSEALQPKTEKARI